MFLLKTLVCKDRESMFILVIKCVVICKTGLERLRRHVYMCVECVLNVYKIIGDKSNSICFFEEIFY